MIRQGLGYETGRTEFIRGERSEKSSFDTVARGLLNIKYIHPTLIYITED